MLQAKNILVLYREDSDDSYEFAAYYADLHNLDFSQLVPLPCSGDEILSSYADFYSQIEKPLLDYIGNEYLANDVRAILVGYGVPGGFFDGIDVIASASRLSRLFSTYSKRTANPLFSRAVYKAYDADDAGVVLITSRIDAPTLEIAKSVVDNTRLAMRQGAVNGKFYFDRYATVSNTDEQSYSDELADFENLTLPILNMTTSKTVYWDEYTDVVISQLDHDSIMWGWRADRSGYSFFKDITTLRFFLYNADSDGAGALRNPEDKRWPMLALTQGYPASAGAMSDPTATGYLRPRPFFETLLRGGTLGEAYTFACPYVDWTTTLIGDPLLPIRFPRGQALSDATTETRGWDQMKNDISDAIGYTLAREQSLIDIYNIILGYKDLDVKVQLFPHAQQLARVVTQSTTPLFSPVINSMVASVTANRSFDDYLDNHGFKISRMWPIILDNQGLASDSNLYDEGYWFVDFELLHSKPDYTTYYFEMDLSLYSDFSTIFLSVSSSLSVTNWQYEKELGSYVAVSSTGVPSNYAGRHIRYASSNTQYLTRGTIFYARYRQRDALGEYDSYRTSAFVVNT